MELVIVEFAVMAIAIWAIAMNLRVRKLERILRAKGRIEAAVKGQLGIAGVRVVTHRYDCTCFDCKRARGMESR
jgi:hypothetical protein